MRVSRVISSVGLVVVLITAFLFQYFVFFLTPVSNQIIENQRNILFNYVSDAAQKIIDKPEGVALLKVYLEKLGYFSTYDVVNIELEDTRQQVVWQANTRTSTYLKTAVLHLPKKFSSNQSDRYFLKVFFNYDSSFFSIPWLSLATVLFLGFVILYELVLGLTNSGLSLSRWCYQNNLYRWMSGDFSRLAFMPPHYSDQSTKKQMFYVQSINEIFSFIKRRCHVLQNSTSSTQIIESCRQVVKSAQGQDKFSDSYVSVLVAWAPMTEVRWLTILLASLLGSVVYLCHDNNVLLVLSVVFPALFLGGVVSNSWGYRYSRRLLGFWSAFLIWVGLFVFFRYFILGCVIIAFAVGFLCHALSLLPCETCDGIGYICPDHEKLSWPIRHFLRGFFIPAPLLYTLSIHTQIDLFSYLPIVSAALVSCFLWYYTYRHPIWRCSLVSLRDGFSFFKRPPFVFMFFFFMAGGLFYVVFSENSYFLAAWFILLSCFFKLLPAVQNNMFLRRSIFVFLGFFVLLLPFLSGFFKDVFSNDGLVFLASLISGYFVEASDRKGELTPNLFSLPALVLILLGNLFFFMMSRWGFLDLMLATFSIWGGVMVWHYGEKDYAH